MISLAEKTYSACLFLDEIEAESQQDLMLAQSLLTENLTQTFLREVIKDNVSVRQYSYGKEYSVSLVVLRPDEAAKLIREEAMQLVSQLNYLHGIPTVNLLKPTFAKE